MALSDILLVLISGSGLLHGLFFAVYLCFFAKKRTGTNLWLGLVLIFMAFRIGKSVLLYFGEDLEPLFIFAGLSFLLLIGPLLHWYVLTMAQPRFRPKTGNFLELGAFFLVFLGGFFVPNDWFDTHNHQAVVLFASVIIFTYLHLAFYIIRSAMVVKRLRDKHPRTARTKSQLAVLQWLHVLIVGLALIWVSYVLNIIEDTVPYIIGPIVYSLVVYYLSYKAFVLKAIQYDGSAFESNTDAQLFQRIEDFVLGKELYLDAEISLTVLGRHIEKSPQKTSEVINQYAKRNFNDYINYHRIQKAKAMLLHENAQKYTISSIAFDCGFNSLSSFNMSFKKFEGMTPSSYRKNRP